MIRIDEAVLRIRAHPDDYGQVVMYAHGRLVVMDPEQARWVASRLIEEADNAVLKKADAPKKGIVRMQGEGRREGGGDGVQALEGRPEGVPGPAGGVPGSDGGRPV